MAQHRTKQDKMKASIHRVENSKLYSLSDINSSKKISSVELKTKTEKEKQYSGLNVRTVKADLQRTGISLVIVLALLSIGYFYLG